MSAIFGEGTAYVPCPDAEEVYTNEPGTEAGRSTYFVAGPCEECVNLWAGTFKQEWSWVNRMVFGVHQDDAWPSSSAAISTSHYPDIPEGSVEDVDCMTWTFPPGATSAGVDYSSQGWQLLLHNGGLGSMFGTYDWELRATDWGDVGPDWEHAPYTVVASGSITANGTTATFSPFPTGVTDIPVNTWPSVIGPFGGTKYAQIYFQFSPYIVSGDGFAQLALVRSNGDGTATFFLQGRSAC